MTEPSCTETAFNRVRALIRLLLDVEKRMASPGQESAETSGVGGSGVRVATTSVEAVVQERVSAAKRANARARSITV
jgi:hypothetical protein